MPCQKIVWLIARPHPQAKNKKIRILKKFRVCLVKKLSGSSLALALKQSARKSEFSRNSEFALSKNSLAHRSPLPSSKAQEYQSQVITKPLTHFILQVQVSLLQKKIKRLPKQLHILHASASTNECRFLF